MGSASPVMPGMDYSIPNNYKKLMMMMMTMMIMADSSQTQPFLFFQKNPKITKKSHFSSFFPSSISPNQQPTIILTINTIT